VIRVALVDDQAMIRQGLRLILESEPGISVVGEAADGRDALEMVPRARPDVVLMDVRMPRLDGIEATRRLHAAGSRARVLVTTFDLDEYVFRALRAGAAGFLLKGSSPDRFAAAVRTVASGESVLDPAITTRMVEHFLARPEFDEDGRARLDELTERERHVLRLLAKGMNNAEMARELFLSEATVKSNVTRMLGKLGVRNRVQAVIVAYETGLVRPGESAS
jgi:DNA-binding NarL/FixJ family response regulator